MAEALFDGSFAQSAPERNGLLPVLIGGPASVQRIDFYLNYNGDRSEPSNHVVGYLDTVGVKTDGTLWISEASNTGAWTGDKMNRFGNETNWQQIVRARHDVLLLKNDGTLWWWGWGTNRFDWNTWQTNWPTEVITSRTKSAPIPIGKKFGATLGTIWSKKPTAVCGV